VEGGDAVRIWVLSGPNLGRLGRREPHLYGTTTLAEIEARARERFAGQAELAFFQSNHEGELIDRIEAAWEGADALVVNPGGLAHTSVALRDALAAYPGRKVEVHLTNTHAREPFRHHLLTAGACEAVVSGFGAEGYLLAIAGLLATAERRGSVG
jgi:3-dehydroquinate dehydratase-2